MTTGTNTDRGTLNGVPAVLQTSRLERVVKYKTWRAPNIMRLLAYLYLLCQSGALFAVPSLETIHDFIITPLTSETNTIIAATTHTTVHISKATHNFELLKNHPPTTLMTMPPLSRTALESRQKYVKEQGNGMDCGVWAGSHCTRVLQGEESRGRHRTTMISSSTNSYENDGTNTIMPLAVTYIILMNLITLWAAMSLA